MPIRKDLSDLPAAAPRGGDAPLTEGTVLAHPLADQWWVQYQTSEHMERSRAMPELPLRASLMGVRCDRQLWYILTETPESNPPGAANVWRMRMGSLIHNEIEATIAPNEFDAEGRKHGWWAEDKVDLRPAGYPGSAHGDLVLYDHGVKQIAGEVKSVGGFAYKLAATNFKGVPEGPRWEHIMQVALVAVAEQVPKIVVLYISPEAVSADVAKSSGLDEYGKFIAEWQYATEEFAADVAEEVRRQVAVLALATPDKTGHGWMPTRELHHPDIAVGATVSNPATGQWEQIDPNTGRVTHTSKCWYCGYCSFRDQCMSDGEEMVRVELTPRPS